jgi:cell division topological specificity factor
MGFFNNGGGSKDVARDRLESVLTNDRVNVSPQLLEMMKNDIVKVISDYMEIDYDEFDIKVVRMKNDENSGKASTIIANIPIKKVKNVGK